MGNVLFSYPATLPAYEAPKRHLVAVDADADSQMQFVLERGSRALQPGETIWLSDYEYGLISPTMFEKGLLIYGGAIDDLGDARRLSLEIQLAALPAVGKSVISFRAPFDGHIVNWRFVTTDPVVTDGKSATLQPRIGTAGGRRDLVGVNEVVNLAEGGSGLTSFTISFGGQTTSSLDNEATAEEIQNALEALSTIGAGNVLVTGDGVGESGGIDIEFINDLGGTNVDSVTTTPTGGTGTVDVTVTTSGAAYTLALTSSGCSDPGETTTGTLTDPTEAEFSEGDLVSIDVIALTAFTEGAGVLEVVLAED